MAVIKIKVKEDGTIEMKGEGFYGQECIQPMHDLASDLGMILEDRPLEDEEIVHISS